jgi:hypothetical protein
MPTDAWDYDYGNPLEEKARKEYIAKLVAKGCSQRKAESVAHRKFR